MRELYKRSATFSAAIAALASSTLAGATSDTVVGEPVPPPWHAAVSPPASRDLTFTSGSARLSGTLHLPADQRTSPVVIVYHGASDALRSAPLYRHLTEMLPALGIGVFVYDRRNSGASTGPSADGSFTRLADDGIAARRMLERVPGVDNKRIGYWGLSQGGWLAALAALRDPNCAFAISISAPMVTADVQMRFAVANILRIQGYDQHAIDQAVAARQGVDDFMRGLTTRAKAQRRLDAAASEPWFDLIYLSKSFRDPQQSSWAAEMRNDPLQVVRAVKSPMLLLFGSSDPWVPVQSSVERLTSLAKRQTNLELHVIDGADHAMMTSASSLQQVDPEATARQAPEAPAYFGTLARWLSDQGLTRAVTRHVRD